jgi:hypothetical protein
LINNPFHFDLIASSDLYSLREPSNPNCASAILERKAALGESSNNAAKRYWFCFGRLLWRKRGHRLRGSIRERR